MTKKKISLKAEFQKKGYWKINQVDGPNNSILEFWGKKNKSVILQIFPDVGLKLYDDQGFEIYIAENEMDRIKIIKKL